MIESSEDKKTIVLEDKKQAINLLEDSIPKVIYVVAAPTMLHMLLETSYHLVNTVWIGKLGASALAAVGASSFLLWLVFSVCSLVEVGVNSLVARYTGSKETDKVNKVSRNGFLYGILLSFIIGLIGILSCETIFRFMELKESVVDDAMLFMIPAFWGLPLFATTTITSAIFRGIGDTKTPLKVLSFTLILNILIAPLFIFGIIFPEMGIAGASYATLLCQGIATLINIYILKSRKIINSDKFFSIEFFKKITKIGLPLSLNGVIFCVVYLFLAKIVSNYGTESVAALGIGQKVESALYCVSVGFSIAATTLVGQCIGANNFERAKNIVSKLIKYISVVVLAFSSLVLIFRKEIVSVFSKESLVIDYSSGYLTAIGFTEVFLGIEIVMEGVFSGLGNTLPPIIIGLPLNIIRIPVAYYAAKNYGVNGIWWTIGITTSLKGIILLLWFKYYSTKKDKKYS